MTGQAKLVIGPAALFPRVDTWSRAGLLAGFAWVDAETVADGLSLEQWQTVDARRVEPGRGGQQQRLMDYLAHLESTSSVVALWLRSPESDAAAGLAAIDRAEAVVQHEAGFHAAAQVFDASLDLKRREITRRSLGRVLLNYPLMTVKVVAMIYWQAARLTLKGAPFYPHPRKRPHTAER